MTNSDYVPVIAAVVGGMLTILGGVAASFMIQRSIRKSEKRALLRSSLEEIYMICNSIKNDTSNSIIEAAQLAEIQEEEMKALRLVHRPTQEVNNIEAICGKLAFFMYSYFPKLKPTIGSLGVALDNFKHAEYLYYLEANSTNMKPSSEQFYSLQLLIKSVKDECRKVQDQIAKEIRRYI